MHSCERRLDGSGERENECEADTKVIPKELSEASQTYGDAEHKTEECNGGECPCYGLLRSQQRYCLLYRENVQPTRRAVSYGYVK